MARSASLLLPVLIFLLLGRMVGSSMTRPDAAESSGFLRVGLPLFTVVLIVLSAVALARRDHLDLSRGRHPEAASRDTAAADDDPHGARARQIAC